MMNKIIRIDEERVKDYIESNKVKISEHEFAVNLIAFSQDRLNGLDTSVKMIDGKYVLTLRKKTKDECVANTSYTHADVSDRYSIVAELTDNDAIGRLIKEVLFI